MTVPALVVLVGVLLVVSALIAASETALLCASRQRLRQLGNTGHRGAQLAERLLTRADELVGAILLLHTAVNFAAVGLACVLVLRTGAAPVVIVAVTVLTLVVAVLCTLLPRSVAAPHAERIAVVAAWPYAVLVPLMRPVTWLSLRLAHGLLRATGRPARSTDASGTLGTDSRVMLAATQAVAPRTHRHQLVNVVDLDEIAVEDIMVPRADIAGIDLEDDWDDIVEQLRANPHTRLPVYEGNLDNVIGTLHMKKVAQSLARGQLSREEVRRLASEREAVFVPAGTTLQTQLLAFQRERRRMALVVSEYGDVQGLVTLEDILEEIVGEFTSDPATVRRGIHRDAGGAYIVSAGTAIRTLNRRLGWQLPTDGPRTLNGLILEYLETIPEAGTALRIAGFTVEILQTVDNGVRTARIVPPAGDASAPGPERSESVP